MDTTRDAILAFIRDQIGFDGPITPDLDLFETGVLDSFNVVEVALFLQQQIGIELQAEDIVRDNFGSIACIEALIAKRRAAVA